MHHIRANAENSVRNLLVEVAKRAGSNILTAVDYLDDGTPVNIFLVFLIGPDLTVPVVSDPIEGGDQRGNTICGTRL